MAAKIDSNRTVEWNVFNVVFFMTMIMCSSFARFDCLIAARSILHILHMLFYHSEHERLQTHFKIIDFILRVQDNCQNEIEKLTDFLKILNCDFWLTKFLGFRFLVLAFELAKTFAD